LDRRLVLPLIEVPARRDYRFSSGASAMTVRGRALLLAIHAEPRSCRRVTRLQVYVMLLA
jgi:hypothetical protein